MNQSDPKRARVAVITGAAQGVGRRTAEVLAERGYSLVLIDLNPSVKEEELPVIMPIFLGWCDKKVIVLQEYKRTDVKDLIGYSFARHRKPSCRLRQTRFGIDQ